MNLSLCIITCRDNYILDKLFKSIKVFQDSFKEIILVIDYRYRKKDGRDLPKYLNEFQSLILLEYDGSKNLPGMRNLAIKKSNSKYIWFIDDDSSISLSIKPGLKKLISLLDSAPEVGFVGTKIIEKRNKKTLKKILYKPVIHPIKGPLFSFGLNQEFLLRKDFPTVRIKNIKFPKINIVQGTSMLFRTNLLKKVNGFNEDLNRGYASFEDSEMGLYLSSLGYLGIYTDYISVHHYKEKRAHSGSRDGINPKFVFGRVKNYSITNLDNTNNNFINSFFKSLNYSIYVSLVVIKNGLKSTNLNKSIFALSLAILLFINNFLFMFMIIKDSIIKKGYRSKLR